MMKILYSSDWKRWLRSGIWLSSVVCLTTLNANAVSFIPEPGKSQKPMLSQTSNLFLSLEVSEKFKRELEKLQKQLPKEKVTLQPRKQFHITIAYFPNVSPEKKKELQQFLKDYLAKESKISIECNGEVVHGSWSRASNDPTYRYQEASVQQEEQIRIGLVLNQALEKFRNDVIAFAKSKEILPPEYAQGFAPHVTIGNATQDFPVAVITSLKVSPKTYYSNLITLQREVSSSQFEILEAYILKDRKSRQENR